MFAMIRLPCISSDLVDVQLIENIHEAHPFLMVFKRNPFRSHYEALAKLSRFVYTIICNNCCIALRNTSLVKEMAWTIKVRLDTRPHNRPGMRCPWMRCTQP